MNIKTGVLLKTEGIIEEHRLDMTENTNNIGIHINLNYINVNR